MLGLRQKLIPRSALPGASMAPVLFGAELAELVVRQIQVEISRADTLQADSAYPRLSRLPNACRSLASQDLVSDLLQACGEWRRRSIKVKAQQLCAVGGGL
jgi:hypothetical protein